MRIVVAAVSSNRCMSGVSRHAANLVKCLLTRPESYFASLSLVAWEHKYVNDAIGARTRGFMSMWSPSGPERCAETSGTTARCLQSPDNCAPTSYILPIPRPFGGGHLPCPTGRDAPRSLSLRHCIEFRFPKVLVNRHNFEALPAECRCHCMRFRQYPASAMGSDAAGMLKAVTINNCVEAAPIVPSHPSCSGGPTPHSSLRGSTSPKQKCPGCPADL